ncbi:hypothetical protein EJ05DRAFT_38761 [Pseudovirgaria hyperparasitica]|uniref:Transcription factor domain-containing protein n=1 Tax=Pseudovirgaria hyperparasitica TaxID=470096 RepID=A0A6A6WMK3_9PEZI|nr:uncharacterized protein EJ05DRAFT_38761 [Pseudovirgaria hyperparasitica]KAF2763441.1 hypothetical protein EJ05DRAFT_38761 [Pseudovirgaria hyperparasitica]
MRNFSFVVQSGTTLDAPSMKSVRSHVTREQMKKRRTLLEQQQQQQQQQQEQLQHAGSDKAQQQQQHKPDPPPPRKARPLTSKTKRNPRGKKKVIPEDQDEQVEMEIRRREEHDDDRHSSSTAPHLLLQSDHTSASTSATSSSAAVVAVAPTCCSSPSGQLTGTAAEFTSMPFSRRRMMQFFNRYYEFMGLYSVASPGIESEYSPFAGQLQQESFTNPAWLTSIALVATQKLDIYRERETTDLLKYKALALNALSKKIKASEVEETTILSVIAFFTYEVSRVVLPSRAPPRPWSHSALSSGTGQ